jgi:predicted signal transduction protein with EAL and GGDEF domain
VVAVKPIHLPGCSKSASVTVSIGVAIWPEDGESPAELLRCADQRLYQAKAEGRDRVVGPTPGKARIAEEQDHEGTVPGEGETASLTPVVPPEV